MPGQIAYLKEQLQQVFEEWQQLGQWQASDQQLLDAVQAHGAQVAASLATSAPCDQQVCSALAELLVIGHLQQDLLEQTLEQAARERTRLMEEGARVRQTLGLLHQVRHAEDLP